MTIHLGGVCIKWLGYGFVEDDMWNPSGPAYRTRIGPAMVIQVAEIWICLGHILAARFSSPDQIRCGSILGFLVKDWC